MKLKSIMKPTAPTVEAGSYLAVCVGVVFIGQQYIPPFGDKPARYENRLVFVWDIPSELDENGSPKQLRKEINVTNSAKGNMMAILSGWNSRTYTMKELADAELYEQLGKPCMLSVGVNENGYANVTAVSAIPKGVPAPVSNTPFIQFNINEWSDEGFTALPEWVQNKIKESTEYQKLHVPTDIVDVDTSGDRQAETAVGVQEQKEGNPI